MSSTPPPPPPPGSVYCGNCGSGVAATAAVCLSCGFKPDTEKKFCRQCGGALKDGQAVCLSCGTAVPSKRLSSSGSGGDKSRVAAGVLAILLGGLGVHKFYLGYNSAGFIMLAGTISGLCLMALLIGILWVWIPGVIALIEGIIYLTKSDAEFEERYVRNNRAWF